MEDSNILDKTFDHFDENDLSLTIRQIARRMVLLKQDIPDIGFMYDTMINFSKIIEGGTMNDEEKNLILNPPPGSDGVAKAIVALKNRLGMRVHAAKNVVDRWIKHNNIKVKIVPDKPISAAMITHGDEKYLYNIRNTIKNNNAILGQINGG